MLTLLLGGCGTGKSTRLIERIREDAMQGRDVLVIVPEQFSFEEEKKLYAALGAQLFNRIHTYSFTTLSRHILETCGGGSREYASDQEKLLYLYRAVQRAREHGLAVLGRNAGSSEFIQSMLGLVTKIRKAGVTAQQLLDTAQLLPGPLADKTSDVGQILFAYDLILREQGTSDGLTDLTEAAALANIQDFFCGKHLYLDEFDSFTGDQYLMLDVMIAFAEHITAAIRTDEPDAKISPIFEGGNQTQRRLRRIAADDHHREVEAFRCDAYCRSEFPDLAAVSTQILRPSIRPAEYCGHVRIAEASDPADEAEWIAASICETLQADETLRCGEIAVAVKSLDDYGTLLSRAFARYGLPCSISEPKPVLHTDLMRHLLAVLDLLTGAQYSTEAILRYLKSPLSGSSAVSVSMLEHYCFTWSVDGEDWLAPFWEEDTELAERAAEFGGKYLEQLRERTVETIAALRKQCLGKPVKTVCRRLYAHLKDCRRHVRHEDTLRQREFTMLWNLLMDILDTIVHCLGEEVLEPEQLRSILLLLCQGSSISTPPQTLDAVQIVEAQSARLSSPKHVFVPGVGENDFPGEIRLGGMFTQQELELLDQNGIALSRMFFELYSDERLIVNKILSAPTEGLWLSYPLANAKGEGVRPSVVIAQIRQMFPDAPLLTRTSALPLVFFARTLESTYHHYVRHFDEDTPEIASLREILLEDPYYAARLARLDGDADAACCVSPARMQEYLGETVWLSPSGIETFYQCPYQYFTRFCLHLYIPERRELSKRNLGNFAHYCLEQILRSYAPEDFTQLTEEQLTGEIRRYAQEFSETTFSDSIRRDQRFRNNYHMAGSGLLRLLVHMQKEMREGQFVPIGFEVALGEGEGSVAPLRLREGAITCVGKIDRIDRCDTPSGPILRVVDYKTGMKLFSPEKLAAGLDMQMLIYLFALRQSEAFSDAVSGGVLYMPSGQPLRRHYGDRKEKKVPTADEILDDFYCMRGLLLEDAAAHMEPEISSGCTPILTDNPDATLFSVDQKQMDALEAHVMERITNMADALTSGEIAPAPYLNYPCKYCSCSDLCSRPDEPLATLSDEERYAAIKQVFDTGEEDEEA